MKKQTCKVACHHDSSSYWLAEVLTHGTTRPVFQLYLNLLIRQLVTKKILYMKKQTCQVVFHHVSTKLITSVTSCHLPLWTEEAA
jgi:hypothetical protein